ncbi:MAG: type IX secretion system membrane protein PorP/SprF [Opitutaceae bacterium]|nr:type IX secretion system membrane protein PorP/SprF [Cytophagales bacterium]
MRSKLTLFFSLFFNVCLVFAQANNYYPDILTVYFLQMATVNPGYVPSEGIADFNAGYKFRTGAFKEISTFSFSGARILRTQNLNSHVIRIMLNNEQQGPYINTPRAYGNYAYELKTGENSSLYAGAALGVAGVYYSATSATASVLLPDGSLGIGAKLGAVSLGISSLQIFNSKASPIVAQFRLGRYYQSNLTLEKELGANWNLRGHVLYRLFPENKDELNIGASLLYSETLLLGSMYRNLYGLGLIAGFYFDSGKDKLLLSFTYNSSVLSRAPVLQNSMEISLGFRVN